MTSVISKLKDFEKSWNEFWFCSVDLRFVSLFRQLFGLVIFSYYGFRWIYLKLFFTDEGLVPLQEGMHFFSGRFFAFYFWFPQSLEAIHLLYAGFMLSLALLTLGIKPRLFAWIALFLHLLFVQRNYAVIYGADKVVSCWLLYLGLCASSVKIKSKEPVWSTDLWSGVGVRLIQIQLCVIYLYSGLEKLRGGTWWSGTALWAILTNQDLVYFDFSFLAHFPLLVVMGSYFAIFFELYFPVAMTYPKLRLWWLKLGAAFHVLIGLLMNLPAFSLVMVLPYLLFLPQVVRKNRLDPLKAQ
ncbi:MAG: HTTM domain-containing protein [Bdellovibrionales bacterium]